MSRPHFFLLLLGTVLSAAARGDDPPGSPADKISYYQQIRPIFQARCQGCHQPAKAKGDYVMTAFDRLLKGGESEEPAIVAGKPDESYLIELIAPAGGKAALTEVLRRRLATDFMEGTQDKGRESDEGPATRDDYIRDLVSGVEVEVEGYPWTRELWNEAVATELRLPATDEARPWLAIGLNRRPPAGARGDKGQKAAVPRPPFWHHSPFAVPDLSELSDATLAFFERCIADGFSDGSSRDGGAP